MKIFVAVSCCVLFVIGLVAPAVAGPLARFAGVLLLAGIAVTVIWPLVTRYPQRKSTIAAADIRPMGSPLPLELQRLTDEAVAGSYGARSLGYDTLLHLRYVARFRLIVGHRLNPDVASDLSKIALVAGPEVAAIVGVWPPDVRGEAMPPVVPANHLPMLIDRLEAL